MKYTFKRILFNSLVYFYGILDFFLALYEVAYLNFINHSLYLS